MPFQKTFRILLEEDNTDGSILDSFGGASFLALNGTDTSGAMNADSVVLGVDGTAAEGKPGWLTEAADGSGDYAKEKCIATNSGWVFMPGSTATGSDNTNAQPEVIECHRRLKDTIGVPTGNQVSIGTSSSKTTFYPDGDTFTGEASSDLGDVVAYVYFNEAVNVTGTPQLQLNQATALGSNFGTIKSSQYNMEQLISSGIKNRILSNSEVFNKRNRKTIEKLSSISYDEYKKFKGHPSFIPYLQKMSTIKYYSKTNIGSRPSKRGDKGDEFNFDKLRAIPFVGSWNQLKQNVPGFYGLGSSINYFYKNNKIKDVKLLYQEVPFFRALVSNSMMSLTKSFFELTSYMSKDEEFGDFWKIINDEYILTKKMLLKISNFKELMENEPANKLSIETRESIVMPLITVQQYALQIVKEIESGKIKNIDKSTFEKIITRSLYGNINASRNSA